MTTLDTFTESTAIQLALQIRPTAIKTCEIFMETFSSLHREINFVWRDLTQKMFVVFLCDSYQTNILFLLHNDKKSSTFLEKTKLE